MLKAPRRARVMQVEQLLREINRKEDRIRELRKSNSGHRNINGHQEVQELEGEVYILWEKVRLARATKVGDAK